MVARGDLQQEARDLPDLLVAARAVLAAAPAFLLHRVVFSGMLWRQHFGDLVRDRLLLV